MIIFFSTIVSLIALSQAANVTNGKHIFQNNCIGCHGELTSDMATPILHGQIEKYIEKQLNNFKQGERQDLMMNGFMNKIVVDLKLTSTDFKDIAAYIHSLNPCDYPVKIESLDGDIAKGKTATSSNNCTQCHTGDNNPLNAPIIKRQKTAYLIHTLTAFGNKKRISNYMNGRSRDLLNEHNIENVAAYLNSQDYCKK